MERYFLVGGALLTFYAVHSSYVRQSHEEKCKAKIYQATKLLQLENQQLYEKLKLEESKNKKNKI